MNTLTFNHVALLAAIVGTVLSLLMENWVAASWAFCSVIWINRCIKHGC